jgi:FixJ family two-component response regulator
VEVRVSGEPLVAIIDDDQSIRQTTEDLLESAGFLAASFASAESFLRSKWLKRVCCMIADVRMPGMSGIELHQRLSASGHAIPTILISAYLDDRVRARALQAGVVCCLAKPFAPEKLLACVRAALTRTLKS